MIYVFVGQDSFSKDAQLKKIKEQFLKKELEQFNFDILFARELTLKDLQERLLCLPLNSPKRIVVIKDAGNLQEGIKEFIINYAKKPYKQVLLILDLDSQGKRNGFLGRLSRFAKLFRFKEAVLVDTFTLNRQINLRRPDYALRVLNKLLKEGERPERILGGLRYAWEKDVSSPIQMKRRLQALLDCDRDIKTGSLQPPFALEKLVINLCGDFAKPLR